MNKEKKMAGCCLSSGEAFASPLISGTPSALNMALMFMCVCHNVLLEVPYFPVYKSHFFMNILSVCLIERCDLYTFYFFGKTAVKIRLVAMTIRSVAG